MKEELKTLYETNPSKEELAEMFHNIYEKTSIEEGWNTQDKCKVDFKDLPEENRKVMIRTCERILFLLELRQKAEAVKWVKKSIKLGRDVKGLFGKITFYFQQIAIQAAFMQFFNLTEKDLEDLK
jgi:uncharacterized protein HemY